jgi:BirA family biotin operon repressor/biotin-[acetyl-CoA-carboxylase] ligase
VSQQLSLVAGLAVFDAVAAAMQGAAARSDLRLKWPNDLMVGKSKLSGILVESSSGSTFGPHWVVMGIGINVTEAPEMPEREVTSLAREGVRVSREALMALLASSMASWIAAWREGAGIAEVRQAWLDRGPAAGEPIAVRQGSERLEGLYHGLDADGALRLLDPAGTVRIISTGEVVRPARQPGIGR